MSNVNLENSIIINGDVFLMKFSAPSITLISLPSTSNLIIGGNF